MMTAAITSLLKSGFITGFLDPEIKTLSRLFPKQQFLFWDSRLSKSVIDRDFKKSRNKCFFHDSNLSTKTKTYFTLSHFFQVWKIAGQISRHFFKNWRLCANPENEFAFSQTSVHLFLFDKMLNIGESPWIDFLE